ncbi:hypothetical protein VH86_09240 [Pantoea sp. BL1]|nr:hypothetical protein VH86_09240 [Pantoea sp. BL1]
MRLKVHVTFLTDAVSALLYLQRVGILTLFSEIPYLPEEQLEPDFLIFPLSTGKPYAQYQCIKHLKNN